MAAVPKVVAVDLGTSTIKFGEFAIGQGGALTLLRFGLAELGIDPNKEEERAKFITPTLSQLFKDHGIHAKEILLSISGQSVFMRFVKLPPVDAAQIEQVVTFEAQQNVPFPLPDVTWDYQMMPNRAAGAEAEAVIVAIKKDIIETEVQAVENAGLKIKRVDVAPFALLNAFRYSESENEGCSLIIDMGARSTNLVFVEKESFWIRNVPIAGNQISQSICNELQEPFVAAEMLKKGKGFVSLGGIYANPDDAEAARISKLIRATMTRLHVDINRSIAFYRTTLGGSAPKHIYLTGGSSQLPYLDLFIAEKHNLPVSYFNPLHNVNLGSGINISQLQQNNCYTSELVGLALRETGSCPAEITLEAPTLVARADKKRKQPYFYGALAAWVLLFVCLGGYYWQQIRLVNQTTKTLGDNTSGLQQMAPEIEKLAKESGSLQRTLDDIVNLGKQRSAWPEILAALNNKIPEGVWITELTPYYDPARGGGNAGGGRGPGAGAPAAASAASRSASGFQVPTTEINLLVISGLYHANAKTQEVDSARLSDFVNSLSELPYFDIDTKKVSETLISFTTSQTDPTAFAQKFSMRLKLKQPISLQP